MLFAESDLPTYVLEPTLAASGNGRWRAVARQMTGIDWGERQVCFQGY
jgi:hypothetical protein